MNKDILLNGASPLQLNQGYQLVNNIINNRRFIYGIYKFLIYIYFLHIAPTELLTVLVNSFLLLTFRSYGAKKINTSSTLNL